MQELSLKSENITHPQDLQQDAITSKKYISFNAPVGGAIVTGQGEEKCEIWSINILPLT